MDSSAFSKLPIDRIIVFAIIGFIATMAGAIGTLIFIAWFVLQHVRIV